MEFEARSVRAPLGARGNNFGYIGLEKIDGLKRSCPLTLDSFQGVRFGRQHRLIRAGPQEGGWSRGENIRHRRKEVLSTGRMSKRQGQLPPGGYWMVLDQAEVSPDSKPSSKMAVLSIVKLR